MSLTFATVPHAHGQHHTHCYLLIFGSLTLRDLRRIEVGRVPLVQDLTFTHCVLGFALFLALVWLLRLSLPLVWLLISWLKLFLVLYLRITCQEEGTAASTSFRGPRARSAKPYLRAARFTSTPPSKIRSSRSCVTCYKNEEALSFILSKRRQLRML